MQLQENFVVVYISHRHSVLCIKPMFDWSYDLTALDNIVDNHALKSGKRELMLKG